MAKKDENILFKKKNTAANKLKKGLIKIIDIFCEIIVVIVKLIFNYFWEIVTLGIFIFIPYKLLSCCDEEAKINNIYIEKINTKKNAVVSKYKETMTFKYDVKFYYEEDNVFHLTTVHNEIINSFNIDRKNIIIYEQAQLDSPYVEIIAKRRPGKVCSFFSTQEAIKKASHNTFAIDIPWGLRDKKSFDVKCNVWFDNKIMYDVTDLVKTNELRLKNDNDQTFSDRRYYVLYVIDEIRLHVPSYEPLQKTKIEKDSIETDTIYVDKSIDEYAMKRIEEKIKKALGDTLVSNALKTPLQKKSHISRHMLCYN